MAFRIRIAFFFVVVSILALLDSSPLPACCPAARGAGGQGLYADEL